MFVAICCALSNLLCIQIVLFCPNTQHVRISSFSCILSRCLITPPRLKRTGLMSCMDASHIDEASDIYASMNHVGILPLAEVLCIKCSKWCDWSMVTNAIVGGCSRECRNDYILWRDATGMLFIRLCQQCNSWCNKQLSESWFHSTHLKAVSKLLMCCTILRQLN